MGNTLTISAVSSPTQFIEASTGKIAYRTLGAGQPIVLFNRFRGILDTWDPAFLDLLATHYTVLTFDYPGIGRSEGSLPTDALSLVEAVKSFTDALGLEQFILGGWSYGGIMAQTFAANYPESVSSLIVIGSNPLGTNAVPPEQIFFDTALKPVNDFADELILFFEPASEVSVAAAKASHDRIAARKEDLDIPVTPEIFPLYFKGGADVREDSYKNREKLFTTTIPILSLMGDHDPSFPVENWFPLVKQSKTMQLIVLPQTGHAPQHQYPELCVDYISAFVKRKERY